ncbi:hypothetical protein HGO37_05410 [Rhizobium sp. CG4]|nr:hypothetical protein [Rhizobium sp. CG4]
MQADIAHMRGERCVGGVKTLPRPLPMAGGIQCHHLIQHRIGKFFIALVFHQIFVGTFIKIDDGLQRGADIQRLGAANAVPAVKVMGGRAFRCLWLGFIEQSGKDIA